MDLALSPAYTQKFLMLRNGLVAPIQKASRSVSEVMVTEMAEERKVSAILSSILNRMSVCRKPDIRMNMSSTPRPGRGKEILKGVL